MEHQRYASRHRRTGARLGLDGERTGDALGAGAHAVQAEATGAAALGQRERVEALAVVADVQGDLTVHEAEGDADASGGRVLRHVRQGFLSDPQEGCRDLPVQVLRRTGERELRAYAGLLGYVLPKRDAADPRADMWTAALGVIAGLVLVVAAYALERVCRVKRPPSEPPPGPAGPLP